MNREIDVPPLVRMLVVVLAFVTAGMVAWACVDDQMLYAATGLLALLITTSPFLVLKKYDLFSPWTVVLICVSVLATPQAICMSFDWPDPEALERMMMLGKEPSYFIYPAAIYLMAWVSFTVGYFCFQRNTTKRLEINRDYSPNNTWIILTISILISIAATIAFIRLEGSTNSNRISAKRTTIETLDVASSEKTQHGYLRFGTKLSAMAFLIIYSYSLARKEKLPLASQTLIGIAFLLACVFPFYTSSRSQVMFIILSGLGVSYYLSYKNFFLKVGALSAIGLTVFIMMSALRSNETSEALSNINFTDSIEKIILNRNGPGLSKTAHIINHIPDPLEFQFGKSFAVWLIAPIPRELFPDKPMIHAGPLIGTTIYGTRVSGIPPGIIAELYWNFYIPGVVFGMLLIGFGLHKGYQVFCNCDAPPEVIVPVYMFAYAPLAYPILSNSLGSGVIMQFVEFAFIASIAFMCTTHAKAENRNLSGQHSQ